MPTFGILEEEMETHWPGYVQKAMGIARQRMACNNGLRL